MAVQHQIIGFDLDCQVFIGHLDPVSAQKQLDRHTVWPDLDLFWIDIIEPIAYEHQNDREHPIGRQSWQQKAAQQRHPQKKAKFGA